VKRFRLCLLLLTVLWVPMGTSAQVFVNENFNAGIPATWSIVNGGSNAATWTGTVGGYNGATLDGSEFAFVNSDGAGNLPPVLLDEQLRSPVVNTTGAVNLQLEYDHFFRGTGQTDSGYVEVYNGVAWVTLLRYGSNTGAFSNPAHVQLNVSAYANPNFQVRFRYNDNSLWAWYWAVDNVQVYAPTPDDASLNAVLSPLSDGRILTQSALGSAVPVSVTLRNTGSTSLGSVPLAYRVNGGPGIVRDTFPGPLATNQSTGFSFATPANLSASGGYAFEVWSDLPSDQNRSNDTLRFRVRQWENAPLRFPYCQNFELTADTGLQNNRIGLQGAPELDFTTSRPGEGRLRTFAGPGFAQSGFRALTLDRNPTGSPNAANAVVFTYNLSGLQANTDQVLFDLALMEHGDEVQPGDSIWIRGCDACTWLRIAAWNNLSLGNNGVYFQLAGFDLSAALAAAGQNYSSSFQIKVGQEDNFNATTPTGSDGLTLDDLCLRRIFQRNASPVALLNPRPGNCGDSSQIISVVVQNAGRDTLLGYPVSVLCSGAGSGLLSGIADTLLPGARDTLVLGTLNTFGGGTLQYSLWTALSADEYLADDTLIGSVDLLGLPAAPLLLGDTVCVGGPALLQVLNPQPEQVYYWYDQPFGGNLLDTGITFLTPPVSGPDNYYTEVRQLRHDRLGPASNAIGSGGAYAVFNSGLRIDAYRDFVLDSLSFYPGDTGLVSLVLRDSGGVKLDSLTWFVQPATPYALTRVAVGFQVPVGVAHQLTGEGSTLFALWRNSSGAQYPYVVDGTAAITSALNNLPGFFYFWYDLRISYPDCPGPRTAISVDTTSVPAQIAFQANTQGLDLQLINTTTGAFNYLWNFGDGTTSTAAAPAHSYVIGDTYRVCLIAYSPCGNDTSCQDILVECLPLQPGFTSSASGLTVSFTDTTAGAIGRFWYFGDGFAAVTPSNTVNHTYALDGVYNVCVRTTNVCGDTALACDSLSFCRVLSCNFSFAVAPDGLTYSFTPFSPTPNLVAYHWDFGDGATSTLPNPTHAYLASGPRLVRLTVTNLCGDTAFSTTSINVLVGTADGLTNRWQVSPNPSTGRFFLRWGAQAPLQAKVSIQDGHGRNLIYPVIDLGNQGFEIDLGAAPAGMYLLSVEADGLLRRFRLVVAR
jgi:PKD repeat protein